MGRRRGRGVEKLTMRSVSISGNKNVGNNKFKWATKPSMDSSAILSSFNKANKSPRASLEVDVVRSLTSSVCRKRIRSTTSMPTGLFPKLLSFMKTASLSIFEVPLYKVIYGTILIIFAR